MTSQHLQSAMLRYCAELCYAGLRGTGLAAACLHLRRLSSVSDSHLSKGSSTSSCSSTPADSAADLYGAEPNAAEAFSQQETTSSKPGRFDRRSSRNRAVQLPPGVFQQTCRLAGKTWTFETGRLAKLAHGSCVVTVGGTSVLSTAVVDPTPQLEADGVPLQVEYRERLAAAGRLPSRPDRRERSGSDREVLAGRLIDRALRPLLPPGHLYDTQVWCQVLSADGFIDPEVVAINAASAALLLARSIPFSHPIGAIKAGQKHHRVLINPTIAILAEPAVGLNMTYAGSPLKATAIEATAKQITNDQFGRAMRLAAQATGKLIRTQLALAEAVQHGSSSSCTAAATAELLLQQQPPVLPLIWPSQQLQEAVRQLMEQPLQQLFSQQQQCDLTAPDKESRAAALSALQSQLLKDLQRIGVIADDHTLLPAAAAAGLESKENTLRAFDMLQSKVMRQQLLQGGSRVDGRQPDQLRSISCQAGPLARCVHGSGLFTRGETQSLATATVGHDRDVGQVETLFSRSSNRSSNNLYLHYSFPPFSVGELGKAGPPNRRELGHGNLARSALVGLMPGEDDFPFSVRITADTLSSSGSSSMAAVCAGSMALRCAGVPMQGLAAGISVGLVTAEPPQLQGPGCGSSALASHGSSNASHSQIEHASSSDGVTSYSSYVVYDSCKQRQERRNETATAIADAGNDSSGSEDDSSAEDLDSISSSDDGRLSSSYGPALLLTDIQGIEDHHGDMDFKVAGSSRGITAVQLDTKLPGVDISLLSAALQPAEAARQQLLAKMSAAAVEYEGSLAADQAPQYGGLEIMKELVPRLIGPQGSTLLEIEETCSSSLIVDDTGAVTIYSPTQLQYQRAVAAVQEVEGRGLKAGQVYQVKVLRVVDFGAYVALPNGLPALLHVSELSHSKIREVKDVVKEGEVFDVLCKGRDAKGFVRLSRKDLLPNPAGGKADAAAIEAVVEKGKSSSSSTSGSDRVSKKPGGQGPRFMKWQPPKQQQGPEDGQQ